MAPSAAVPAVRNAALKAFMIKELRHIARDRQTLVILLFLPLALILIFGFAIRTDVPAVRVLFIDPTPSAATTGLQARFVGSGRFEMVGAAPTTAAIDPYFRRGEADLAVVFEPDFAAHLATGNPAGVYLISDAADPNTGRTVLAYGRAEIAAYRTELAGSAPDGRGVRIGVRTRMLFNPTLESANLFVPGLIGLVLTIVTGLMTAVSLAREKESGTMEILLVSPLRPWQIILGKVLPYLLLAFANVVSSLLAAWLVFDVPFRGSVSLLLAASMVYAGTGLSLGVLIAAATDSQRAAMLGALAGTMLPNLLLSGMIFPVASLPDWLQPLTPIIPARWFNIISRAIMLQGVGIEHLWEPIAILIVMLVVFLTAAVVSFRPRLG